MRVELKKLHDRLGTTAIYVTHDQVEAMTLGDRVVVMRDGLVQQVGEPLELYNEPANRFVAGFLGSPAMNFAPVRVSQDMARSGPRATACSIKVPAPNVPTGSAVMSARRSLSGSGPEDLRVASDGRPDRAGGFDVVVEVVERLGSEILLDVAVGPTRWSPPSSRTSRAKMHERLRLALNPERLHFFDRQSEAAI